MISNLPHIPIKPLTKKHQIKFSSSNFFFCFYEKVYSIFLEQNLMEKNCGLISPHFLKKIEKVED
jgi:hypothetical protein